MTNEEAIEFIKTDISRLWNTPQNLKHKEALEMAIKALEQKPKTIVLNKIRAEIELVIKISEKAYNALTHTVFDANLVVDEMRKSIVNGTPLPKGHGRLIDADALNRKDVNCANVPMNFIDTAPTIVEANTVESEE